MVPNNLSTFHRIDANNGMFNYNLNNDLVYDFVVIGINEKGYSMHRELTIRSGNYENVELESITESKLDQTLAQLKTNKSHLSQEWDWLKKEQRDIKVQNQRKNMGVFRQKVTTSISPCIVLNNEETSEISSGTNQPKKFH